MSAGDVMVGDRDKLPALLPAADWLTQLRQPKVEHLHIAVGHDLDVRGLQVAVDDAFVMGDFERLGDLPRDAQHIIERQSSAVRV